MQTFLPFPDFKLSAQALDNQRLGKQRIEVLTLLRGKYSNHPAKKMWAGFEFQLAEYGKAICLEWLSRTSKKGIPFRDTCLGKISREQARFSNTGLPPWFGSYAFHEAHKSRLIAKKPEYYRDMFPGTREGLDALWG